MNYRVYVEKLPQFQVEARSLCAELNENLGLKMHHLRLLNVYDLFGFTEELVDACRYSVFGETVTDKVSVGEAAELLGEAAGPLDEAAKPLDEAAKLLGEAAELLEGERYLAVEFIPGQFDQRASSAVDCVHLIDPQANVQIRSARLLIFDETIGDAELAKIKAYYINAVEAREKDMLAPLTDEINADVKPLARLDGFTDMPTSEYAHFCKQWGLAMNADDLGCVVDYFRSEKRQPTETELRILDTYWSDHCRHTTFTTELEEIHIDDSFIKDELESELGRFHDIRKALGREHKSLCLMELATIGARYLRAKGLLDDMEVSEENNACSIYIDVDVSSTPTLPRGEGEGIKERWLLQFKNETHNHPTEIEPFGGASTCLGGAIRDPLSGRAYVYQAMRVTGAGDIYKPVSETLPGKLPQQVISRKAAAGYSSYGNQIGLATTHVREIYHPSYVAKRLEVGAVVGAVKADYVRRESPAPGDVILLLGGRTGRDGIGGATGSSKEHTEASLESCGSEVQKGNAPEERKIQRLFRRPEVTRLIKKSNDFGAGGVSVAIGELADGLDIYLDRVPTKYSGLNPTELAISESQERMAVVVEAKDRAEFESYCVRDNIEVTHVADVTDSARMRQIYKGEVVADLRRDFIDSAGAKHYAKATIGAVEQKNPFVQQPAGDTLAEKMKSVMSAPNVTSQKGLIENFDATIGRSTVLMPFGGKTQLTETQVSMQKLPTDSLTHTASVMAFGYNPFISEWSPYHGAAYAVVEACAKVVASGAAYDKMRFSYQEYFERMTSEHSYGKPLAALLGALKMQVALGLPSIGGKDSMSGTFEHISVPPTLIAFGITTLDARKAISPEWKEAGHRLYLVQHHALDNYMPNTDELKQNWTNITAAIESGKICSAYALGFGGLAEALAKCAFGNALSAKIDLSNLPSGLDALYAYNYGSILVEATDVLSFDNALLLGEVTEGDALVINGEQVDLDLLLDACCRPFTKVYADAVKPQHDEVNPWDADGASSTLDVASSMLDEATASLGVASSMLDEATASLGVASLMLDEATASLGVATSSLDEASSMLDEATSSLDEVVVYIPVFPGTNCDYDSAKAWRKAGAKVETSVFCNLTSADVLRSIDEMVEHISRAQILMFAGGFSAGDEPDGSAKFIACVINNKKVSEAIEALIARGGLILGICNGFQALIKSGLLPYGKCGCVTPDSPTLFRNDINRHVSQMVTTRVETVNSPWLAGMQIGDLHSIAVSHGEGKFVVSEQLARELFRKGQVAFRYADPATGEATMEAPANPNGSYYAIEGIISENGQILGKMGHTERWEDDVFKNISGNKHQPLFENAVRYFRGK